MKTPLAWLNLAHNKMRTAAAVSGVTFAVVLIFMQLGFLGSVSETAGLVYEALEFDLLIRSRRYLHLADTQSFSRARLHQAASLAGVRSALPLHVGVNHWRNPDNGSKRRILTVGVGLENPVFKQAEIRRKLALLTCEEFVLIDRESRHEFGPYNGKRFSAKDIGQETEVGYRRVRIVDHFSLGAGFAADGAILLSEQGFCRVQPGRSADEISLGLVKLEDGVRADEAAAILTDALPKDVKVLTRRKVLKFERDIWLHDMSIGIIFRLGVVVGLMVGMAIVYQVLSSDVSTHLGEYATLKAIGYRESFLAKIVLQQAIALSVLGFLPGVALAEVLYRITSHVANVPIEMSLGRILFVLALSVAMCTVSGLGALRKVRSAEPADLY